MGVGYNAILIKEHCPLNKWIRASTLAELIEEAENYPMTSGKVAKAIEHRLPRPMFETTNPVLGVEKKYRRLV